MITVLNVLNDERLAGPQLQVLQVATRLRDQGIQTVVVIPKGDPNFSGLLQRENIPYEEMGLGRPRQLGLPLENLRFLARFWSDVWVLRRLIRRHDAHLVHVHGLRNLQPAIAAHLEGTRLVWHFHDMVTPRFWRALFLPLACAWADRIIVVSRATAAHYFYDNEARQKLTVLYPPVDTQRFHPGVDTGRIVKELELAASSPIIGMVGNIHPGKGIDLFLEATVSIRAAFPNLKVLMIGDLLPSRRGYWVSLMKRAEALGLGKTFLFLGRRHDVPQLLAALSVYVHTARTEPAGMAIMEASACGLPVVATDVGGIGGIVEDGVSGVLVAPDSPEQIATAVIRLLNSPHEARRMGAAGVERARIHFSLETCAAEHLRLYREVLDRDRRPTAYEPL